MLYIVATPIGNLMDFSFRAIEILKKVNLIAVEDTRRAKILLNNYNITTKIVSFHNNNERQILNKLLLFLKNGEDLALISDAGTPLINDPGYYLVRKSHSLKIPVTTIPGPCAAIAAISVSGLAVDQFIFIGFLPLNLSHKQNLLIDLRVSSRTMIFFEAPHRLLETLSCMLKIFGPNRQVTFCRELTKKFETIILDQLDNIYNLVAQDEINQTKGEIVLVVAGLPKDELAISNLNSIDLKVHNMLKILKDELPTNKVASLVSKITGISRNVLYKYLIAKDL